MFLIVGLLGVLVFGNLFLSLSLHSLWIYSNFNSNNICSGRSLAVRLSTYQHILLWSVIIVSCSLAYTVQKLAGTVNRVVIICNLNLHLLFTIRKFSPQVQIQPVFFVRTASPNFNVQLNGDKLLPVMGPVEENWEKKYWSFKTVLHLDITLELITKQFYS